MPDRLVIRDLATPQEHKGSCAESAVRFVYGELALDALGHATAQDILAALRGQVSAESAKIIVELLLDNGLLFDSTIESELGE